MGFDEACKALESALPDDPAVKAAFRIVIRAARRGRRISETTIPRINNVGQHAILIRDAIDLLIPALPPTLFAVATAARDHTVAIVEASRTHAESEPPEPEED